ncbi:MAG: 3-phosphoglycerate dehydrogenase [Alphaproteobacteria bacterium]|nr:3-phosphoglycerate dehydrogenase [Alphaproteobacteria bacterium]
MARRRIVYPDAGADAPRQLTGARLARLEALGDFALHVGTRSDADFGARLAEADGIISAWGLDAAHMRAAPRLKIISFTGLGAANFIDLDEAARLGITVTHTLSTAETVAEHTMALMLAATRHIARLDRETRACGWNQGLQGFDLRGKTLGLVGFGRIAQATVPLARAFGMDVIAWTRRPEPAAHPDVAFLALDDVLARADVVSFHLLLTRETTGLITDQHLRRMKPGVVVVNTARAQILDEATLIELLRTGHIAAAGLDVFAIEPLPAGHPLTRLDNVVLTPHSGFNTPEGSLAILDGAIENLEAFYTGRPKNVATRA